MCSPDLLRNANDIRQLLETAPLIDSPLSPVTWRDWFEANGMPMPNRPRPSFDRAALAIAAAVDNMGLVLESVRLAEREIGRGELVEIGAAQFVQFERETHFMSCRSSELHQPKLATFRQWLLNAAGSRAPSR
jgi:DNA-binding transcriptional LysR family regulator